MMESDHRRCVHDTDAASAALSLCALSHHLTRAETPAQRPLSYTSNEFNSAASSSTNLPASNLFGACLVQATALPAPTPPCIAAPPYRQPVCAPPPASLAAPRRKAMRPRDPKRDAGVTYEEMKRLMRVYGPLTSLRNRAGKDAGGAAQPASIKRKFYR